MASTMHSLKGIASWARVFEVNYDREYENFNLEVVMDKEEFDEFVATGSRLHGKPTDDGVQVKFRRPHTHNTYPEFGGAPKVAHADNTLWNIDEDGLIGNGSEVEVFFTVYDSAKGKGTRLEGVRVLSHVPYEGSGEGSTTSRLPF